MPANIFLTGASAGIGLTIAQMLTAQGHAVWGTSRDPARLPQLPHFHPVTMDLADPASIHRNFPDGERFDILINNAGAGLFGPCEMLPAADVAAQFQVMLHTPHELIRLILPGMRARQQGLIINITSLAADFPIPYMAAYNAAKASLSSLTACLRLELADTAIRVVEIQPGDIRTGFHPGTKQLPMDSGQSRSALAWRLYQSRPHGAPPPERVARAVQRIIAARRPPPVVRVGGLFQARVAPLLARFGSARLIERLTRHYYRL